MRNVPIESLARGIRAVRSRVLRCFGEVGKIDSRRKLRAEGELSIAKAHFERGEYAIGRRHISNALASAWENGLSWNTRDSTGTVPLHARAWELTAKSYFDQGEEEKGSKCVDAALLAANEVAILGNGLARLKAGDFGGAQKRFDLAEKTGRKYAELASKLLRRRLRGDGSAALVSMGYARMLAGDFRGALRKFEEALKKDEANFEAWAAKASALDALGKTGDASVWYEKVRKEASK